jgi:uncharacterized metal-binding protein
VKNSFLSVSLHILFHLILKILSNAVITPVLQMQKLRLTRVKVTWPEWLNL